MVPPPDSPPARPAPPPECPNDFLTAVYVVAHDVVYVVRVHPPLGTDTEEGEDEAVRREVVRVCTQKTERAKKRDPEMHKKERETEREKKREHKDKAREKHNPERNHRRERETANERNEDGNKLGRTGERQKQKYKRSEVNGRIHEQTERHHICSKSKILVHVAQQKQREGIKKETVSLRRTQK